VGVGGVGIWRLGRWGGIVEIQTVKSILLTPLCLAIGKEVTPVDFTNYLSFHNRKLFKSKYKPLLFCHSVRRPDHVPEGIYWQLE